MKKGISVILILATVVLFGCSSPKKDNSDKDMELSITEKISQSCGHHTNGGIELSYDLMLKSIYSGDNVEWEEFEYDDLYFLEYSKLNMTTGESEKHPLKREYEYALARVKSEGREFELVFIYDNVAGNVIDCFEHRDILYLEWWDAFESLYCGYHCKCYEK